MNPYTQPQISDFKAYFTRDFIYGSDPTTVEDSDISNAFIDATMMVNPAFFPNQAAYNVGFLWLAAHFLVTNLRASSQGAKGEFSWLISSKSVGSVSEGFTIPQSILDNPVVALISTTYYGTKYLLYILPQLIGNVFTVYGDANP